MSIRKVILSALMLSASASVVMIGSPAKAATELFLSTDGGATDAATASTPSTINYSGTQGVFTVTATATGAPPLSGAALLDTNSINITASSAGSMTVWITETGLTAPLTAGFLTSFTTQPVPTGWSVVETSFVSTTDAKYGGTLLDSVTFGPSGSPQVDLQTALISSGAGPYSVSAEYFITASTNDNVNSTIDINAVVPLPGALPLFASGVVGLLALGRKRKKQKLESAFA